MIQILYGLFALFVALSPSVARAHTRSVSYATFHREGEEARLRLRLSELDLSLLESTGVGGAWSESRAPHGAAAASAELRAYLLARLSVEGEGGGRCAPIEGSFGRLSAPRGWARFEWRVRCEGAPFAVRSRLLLAAPSHTCFLRVLEAEEGAGEERLLDRHHERARIGGPGGLGLGRMVRLGAEHIAGGADHLLFLLLLLLLAPGLRALLGLVTGFTLGHSLSLAAASLGWVSPRASQVELLIGLSILLLAAESLWVRAGAESAAPRERLLGRLPLICGASACLLLGPWAGLSALGLGLFAACYFGLLLRLAPTEGGGGGLRVFVSALFGLVHGLGFAGALAEGGGPPSIPGLFGFNLGVELGQLALLLLAWPLWHLLRRGEGGEERGRRVGLLVSALGLAAGLRWVLLRAAVL